MKWSTILVLHFLLKSDSPLNLITHKSLHIQSNDDVLTSVTPAKFCQRLQVIKSFNQSIALTRKICIIVIKKTIQRNHMFAIFALWFTGCDIWLLTPSAFFTYSEYRFEPPHDKTNKMTVRPAKTQISLGICPV